MSEPQISVSPPPEPLKTISPEVQKKRKEEMARMIAPLIRELKTKESGKSFTVDNLSTGASKSRMNLSELQKHLEASLGDLASRFSDSEFTYQNEGEGVVIYRDKTKIRKIRIEEEVSQTHPQVREAGNRPRGEAEKPRQGEILSTSSEPPKIGGVEAATVGLHSLNDKADFQRFMNNIKSTGDVAVKRFNVFVTEQDEEAKKPEEHLIDVDQLETALNNLLNETSEKYPDDEKLQPKFYWKRIPNGSELYQQDPGKAPVLLRIIRAKVPRPVSHQEETKVPNLPEEAPQQTEPVEEATTVAETIAAVELASEPYGDSDDLKRLMNKLLNSRLGKYSREGNFVIRNSAGETEVTDRRNLVAKLAEREVWIRDQYSAAAKDLPPEIKAEGRGYVPKPWVTLEEDGGEVVFRITIDWTKQDKEGNWLRKPTSIPIGEIEIRPISSKEASLLRQERDQQERERKKIQEDRDRAEQTDLHDKKQFQDLISSELKKLKGDSNLQEAIAKLRDGEQEEAYSKIEARIKDTLKELVGKKVLQLNEKLPPDTKLSLDDRLNILEEAYESIVDVMSQYASEKRTLAFLFSWGFPTSLPELLGAGGLLKAEKLSAHLRQKVEPLLEEVAREIVSEVSGDYFKEVLTSTNNQDLESQLKKLVNDIDSREFVPTFLGRIGSRLKLRRERKLPEVQELATKLQEAIGFTDFIAALKNGGQFLDTELERLDKLISYLDRLPQYREQVNEVEEAKNKLDEIQAMILKEADVRGVHKENIVKIKNLRNLNFQERTKILEDLRQTLESEVKVLKRDGDRSPLIQSHEKLLKGISEYEAVLATSRQLVTADPKEVEEAYNRAVIELKEKNRRNAKATSDKDLKTIREATVRTMNNQLRADVAKLAALENQIEGLSKWIMTELPTTDWWFEETMSRLKDSDTQAMLKAAAHDARRKLIQASQGQVAI